MKRLLLGVLMCMSVSGAYANCNGRILHAGNGMICMQASDNITRPALCTRVEGIKYCASLVAGNLGRLHVAINGVTYSAPDFMEETESIRFDGESYIDLGFVPTTDLNFEIRADLDESVNYRDGALMGARSTIDDQYVVWYNTLNGHITLAPRLFTGFFQDLTAPDGALTLRWENEVFTINGVAQKIEYFTTPMNQGEVNLVLGGVESWGSVDSRRFLGDIYYAKFWDSGGVIMDLVAATDAKGNAGMFDKVSGRMFYPVH